MTADDARRGAITRMTADDARAGAAARVARLRFPLILAALSIFAAGAVLLREATYGPAIVHDAVIYISTARSLLDGGGFVQYDSRPYTQAAPLFPITLAAAASATGFDPRDVAGPFNAAVFGLTVFAAGWWLRARIQPRILLAFSCLAVALSAPLAASASSAMSDSLFILLTVLALSRADRHISGGGRSTLIWAIAFTALACLTRYIGVSLIIAIGLALALLGAGSLLPRLRDAVLFSAASAAPLCFWLALRSPNSDYASDVYLSALLPPQPSEVFDRALALVERFYLAAGKGLFNELPLGGVGAVVAGGAAVAAVALFAAWGGALVARSLRNGQFTSAGYAALCVAALFIAAYVAALFATLALVGSHYFLGRFMLPLHIPALFAGAFMLDKAFSGGESAAFGWTGWTEWTRQRRGGKARAAALAAIGAAFSLWLAYGAAEIGRGIAQANSGEIATRELGAAHPRFAHSETLRHMREAPIEGTTLSNAGRFIVYLNTDIYAPRLHLPELDKASARACLARIAANSDRDPHIVWFYDLDEWSSANDYSGLDAAFIRALPWAKPVAELSDGAIFRVDRQAMAAAMGNGEWRAASAPIPRYHPGSIGGSHKWAPANDGSCGALRQYAQHIHRR